MCADIVSTGGAENGHIQIGHTAAVFASVRAVVRRPRPQIVGHL